MFYVPTPNFEASAYNELANFDSYQQKPPAIASLADTEIDECVEETSGITPPICHSQSMERHVKFVAEASAQVARVDRRDASFHKKVKSRKLTKTFDTKKQFK